LPDPDPANANECVDIVDPSAFLIEDLGFWQKRGFLIGLYFEALDISVARAHFHARDADADHTTREIGARNSFAERIPLCERLDPEHFVVLVLHFVCRAANYRAQRGSSGAILRADRETLDLFFHDVVLESSEPNSNPVEDLTLVDCSRRKRHCAHDFLLDAADDRT
jgi:hypothetical protein